MKLKFVYILVKVEVIHIDETHDKMHETNLAVYEDYNKIKDLKERWIPKNNPNGYEFIRIDKVKLY